LNWEPDVDVVVPCYNVEHIINKCIKSLLRQYYNNNKINIYLVDDGSTDKTGDILDSFGRYNNINIIHHKKNMSQSSARNTGIREGNSEVICFLDSDMIVNKNWILTHIDILSDRNIVGVVGDQILPKGEIAKPLDKYLYNKRRGARQFTKNVSISFPYFLFSNASLKRSVFNTIDVFDEKFNSYGGEDTELAIRLWEAYPTSLRFSPHAISENHGNQKFEDFCQKMYEYGQKNFLLLIKKHPKYLNKLGGKYINSVKGYVIFNPINRFVVYLLGLIIENYWLTRYLVVDHVIRGARKTKKKDYNPNP